MHGCAHVSHVRIRRAVLLFVSYKSRVGSEKNMPEKLNIDEKYAATISEGTIAKCLIIEARSGIDRNTTRARTSLCPVRTKTYSYGSKQQKEVLPICSTAIICTSTICRCIYVGYE